MRHLIPLFLCLLILILGGCTAMPPPASLVHDTSTDTTLVSADTRNIDETECTATLYFRYLDTGMLAAQEQMVSIPKNETREKALVQALLNGPGASASQLTAVFQAGVTIISTQAVNGVLFVTFDETLLGGYEDEPSVLSTPYWQMETPLRRELAMTALVATLTENGQYQGVQILVRGQTQVATSMRLNQSFFMRGEDSLTGPMTRNESKLLTQANTARIILEAWQQGDVKSLYRFTAAKDPDTGAVRPAEQTAQAALSQAGSLLEFTITPGNVSPNGQTAVLCADFTLRTPSGEVSCYTAWPMVLVREAGIWKMSYENLASMMAHE